MNRCRRHGSQLVPGSMVVSSDLDVIKRIIDAFERSDWTEIDVRAGSLRVHLSVDADIAAHDEAGATRPAAMPADTDSEPARPDNTGAPYTTQPSDLPPDVHLVVSPSPGILWRSPQPGAPPFASVGDRVEASSTMCIVEVMKLMTHVKSEVAGAVVGIFVDDGARVDQGDPLFAIAPES